MALRLVPKEVFQDARATIKPAVCTATCLSLLALASANAARLAAPATGMNHLDASLANKINPNSTRAETPELLPRPLGAMQTAVVFQEASMLTKAGVISQRHSECGGLAIAQSLQCHCSVSPQKNGQLASLAAKFDDREQFWLDDVQARSAFSNRFGIVQTESIAIYDPSGVRASLPISLMTRGGQHQLYSPEAASTSFHARCSAQVPPQLAGGIFSGHYEQHLSKRVGIPRKNSMVSTLFVRNAYGTSR